MKQKEVILEYTMKEFQQEVQIQLDKMAATGKLFRSSVGGNEVWNMYITSFENDPKFRDPASSEHNCNLCKNFIRRYGNIVAIVDNQILTIWDKVSKDTEYSNVAKAISKWLKMHKVENVFFETFNELNSLNYEKCSMTNSHFRLGLAKNVKRYTKEEAEKFGVVKANEIREFNHLHLDLPTGFVDNTGNSIEAIMSGYRDAKNVFQRGMETISLDTLYLVRDLINQGSLLDGTTHLHKIEAIIPLKVEYDSISAKERDNWCWLKSYKFQFAKFRNELIGVLCSELSEGLELNEACKNWNKRVDPQNYMKATAPITKKQIEEAKKFIEENGYEESFNRRLATIDDIKVSEILHSNVGKGELKKVSIFDSVKSTSTRHKRSEFEGVEEVGIEKFMKDILPTCSSVEVFLQNNHENNMVSLTTANNPDSKKIFKWDNNYSWTFNGNLAGKSEIKQAVKERGGIVDAVLRSSMIWNESGNDTSDLDLWCSQPDKQLIGFNTAFRADRGILGSSFSSCSGQLDLDNTNPGTKLGVENIYFKDLKKMKDGTYTFWVNQYNARNSQGFKFEIEFNGEVYTYEYNKPVRGDVKVAEVTLKKGEFTINHLIPESAVSNKEIYGLETNQFHKVNLVCLSPNHWGTNNVGNKHYFFMLNNCKVSSPVRGFHIENLTTDLLNHRKVFEVVGNTNMITPTDKQLSGLGFNSTVRAEVIVKLKGSHNRMVKVKF